MTSRGPRSKARPEERTAASTRTPAGEDPRTFGALGSPVRLRILDSIAAGDKTIAQLSQELGLHRITLRYHLNYLVKQGLAEESLPPGPRRVGRPPVHYRGSPHAKVSGYPQRHFEIVGQIAMEALVDAAGPAAAREYLRRHGFKAGRTFIEAIATREGVGRWTPETFEALVVHGRLRDMGIPTEVISRSRGALEFRAFSCPFLELAQWMPDLVCNALDGGFHAGMGAAVGGMRTRRIACMGHGDSFCQYRMVFESPSKPGPGTAAREDEESWQEVRA